MKLKSNIESLLHLEMHELLDLQDDVNKLIRLKFEQLPNNNIDSLNKENANIYIKNEQNANEIFLKESSKPHTFIEDTEDFILTQFDQDAQGRLFNQISNVNDDQMINIKKEYENEKFEPLNLDEKKNFNDLSSPLKGSSLKGSQVLGSQESITSRYNIHEETGRKRVKLERIDLALTGMDYSVKRNLIKIFDFNKNPITLKAWILEDFKPNENKLAIIRGRKREENIKLMKLHSKMGKPPNQPDNCIENFDNGNLFTEEEQEFDNLKTRSKSPPGFGRLDFPNTQERFDDRKKSQQIIYQKTKRRFKMTIRNDIPPQEREYHFKNDELNRIVDDGNFKWDEINLLIYSRN